MPISSFRFPFTKAQVTKIIFGDILTGLVGRWQFENDDTDSVGSNHGTPFGSPTFVDGKVGLKARSFDSSATIVFIDGDHIINTDDWSISCWLFPSGAAGSYRIAVCNGDTVASGGYSGIQLGRDPSNNAWAEVFTGADSSTVIMSTGALTNAAWSFVVLTKSGTDLKLYVNAETPVTETTTSSTMDYSSNAPNTRVGSNSAGGDGWVGHIDEVRFYETVLSAENITQIYNFQK